MFSLICVRKDMRMTGHTKNRFLGYVQVRVASQVHTLPVEAMPPIGERDAERKLGFTLGDGEHLSIVVDGDASDKEQRETIEQASVDAAKHLSRRLLN
jgi:hypothetical protein